jgi:hypothetical protein
MARRSLVLGLAVSAAFALQATAAQLHWPLPPDSTERNGEPQMKASHLGRYIAPPALPEVGLHPRAEQGLKRRYTGTPIDVLNYHYDNYPTGWNQSETDLTPATVHSASFGQIKTLNVDGNVFAEPLIVSNFTMPDNSVHNVLLIATGGDTVYAYDAQDYTLLWKKSMGKPQSTNDVGCGDIQPEYGISSTPVILRTGPGAAQVFLVAATEPAPFSFHTKIHDLDLATGEDVRNPVEIAPQANLETGGKIHFDPQNQWNRASLVRSGNNIYVGIGSHCDNNAGQISGWILRYDPNLHLLGKFNTIEATAGYELSSVWMSGYAPAVDANGNVFAVTGNGNYSTKKGQKGYGESVISLNAGLKKVKNFTPSNFQDLNDGDTDFGSGGAMLIPTVSGQVAPPMLVAMGKASTLYLLDSTNLGGLEGHHGNHALQTVNVPSGGCWCGPAYYVGPSGGLVYYQGSGDVLRAYKVATGATPSLTDTADGTSGAGFGGSFPIVSSNGATANTGVVWVIRRGDTEQIEAYDAVNMGAPLFQSNAGVWSNGSRAYLSPLVANGRVYVPAYKTVTVFGLTD